VVNSHLWEFPNLETTGQKTDATALAKDLFGITPATLEPLCTVKHSITRYRITLNAFLNSFNAIPAKSEGVWKSPARMRLLAFTAAHKKLATSAANRILSDR